MKLQVSNLFLQLLVEKQQKQEYVGANNARYCWIADTTTTTTVVDDDDSNRGGVVTTTTPTTAATTTRNDNNMDRIIKDNGLPQYRPLEQIIDEYRSVFDSPSTQRSDGDGNGDSGNTNSNINNGGYGNKRNHNSSTGKKKKESPSLTLEQQSKLMQLQSAYKIALQKEDTGAINRIRKAMDELENDVMMKQKITRNEDVKYVDDDDEVVLSGLSSIRRAMKISEGSSSSSSSGRSSSSRRSRGVGVGE